MCIIFNKPLNVAFPEESIMQNCWDNNPDMGGFMYTYNGKVYIKKGYKTWESFKQALDNTRKITGDNVPYVCHFRISTQGYDVSCCQPFPLSAKMNNLKKRKAECCIGVAHNGILSLTSDGAKDYSDTMKFITDYLVNIIQSYSWYENARTKTLIENLIDGSRLAILDTKGHCEMLGHGWIEDKGVYYSNSTYSYKKYKYTETYSKGWGWDDDYDFGYYDYNNKSWKKTKGKKESKTEKEHNDFFMGSLNKVEKKTSWFDWWNRGSMSYDFEEHYCPYSEEDDDTYCAYCSNVANCSYTASCGIMQKKA